MFSHENSFTGFLQFRPVDLLADNGMKIFWLHGGGHFFPKVFFKVHGTVIGTDPKKAHPSQDKGEKQRFLTPDFLPDQWKPPETKDSYEPECKKELPHPDCQRHQPMLQIPEDE